MVFEGSMTALVTPFKNDGIDEAALRRFIDFQIQNGTSVLVPCGTTGESATMSHEEHERAIRVTVEQSAGRAKVLAGAGSNATAEALRLHAFCKKVGADGALHITPYYNKPPQAGLYAHFKAIAESSDLPVVLYNVPGRTGVNMLPETVARLARIANIVGIKEASGSLDQVSEIIAAAPAGFGVYSGEDSLTYPMYALGARGAISVTANVAPAELSRQYEFARKGDFASAREIHYQLFALHKALFIETNPIPAKAALALMGMIEEEYRLPLVPMAPQNREKLKSVLKELGKVF
jgi:4-hydroxy-tetrahydrodipicolinate synthase